MKFPLWLVGLALALIGCKNQSKTNAPTPERPPNVIIVFTDDQGYNDVGVFGANDIATPHLDRMAANGLTLTNFYSAQAVCSASRAGLLTGCYPNRIGIHNAFMPNAPIGLNPKETTMAEMLKSIGYSTAIFGKWHLGDQPEFMPTNQGFDEYFGIPYSNDMWPLHPQQGPIFDFGPLPLYENEKVIDTLTDQTHLTTQITERGVDFIKRNKANPFFLYIAHPQPHVPLFVSDKFKGKSGRGLYGDVIMEIDWSVGQLIQTLKEEGLEDDTLVIFTSDNGPWLAYGNHAGSAYPLREGKGTAWEGGQREPFIAQYPKSFLKGKTLDQPLMAIDLLPTIAELTGAPLPQKTIDGKSALSLFEGSSQESPQDTYFFYYRVNELHGLRHKNWKMYFPHKYRTLNGGEAGTNGQAGRYNYVDMEEVELYNLDTDVSEKNNVAEQQPEIVATMTALAEEMRQELGDALTEQKGTGNREPGKIPRHKTE